MIEVPELDAQRIQMLARQCQLVDTYGPVVTCREPIAADILGAEPCVVIGTDVKPQRRADLDAILRSIAAHPIASVTAAVLCRTSAQVTNMDARFVMESAAYSALQSGPEFAQWHASRNANANHNNVIDREYQDGDPMVATRITTNHGDAIEITLRRPHKGNAVDTVMRDRLVETLTLALADPSINHVRLTGSGKHFCTGGDLDTFASAPSPGEAYVYRLQRSPHRMWAKLRASFGQQFIAHVHGNTMGSGVEWAAFAGTLMAHTKTTFSLPEVSLGLVPGAGGTVSVVDRIGYPRTLDLLLTGRTIDTATALAWGLIDGVEDSLRTSP
jgi:enoyl-CoA hydratase/carnithine racemase